MTRIRVLVVDDHRIFAESLAAALAAEPDVEVAAAGSGPAAFRCLERAAAEGRRFDVVLIDADLGTPDGSLPARPPTAAAVPPPAVPSPGVPAPAGPLRTPPADGPGPLAANGTANSSHRRANSSPAPHAASNLPHGTHAAPNPQPAAPHSPHVPQGGAAHAPDARFATPNRTPDGISLIAPLRSAHPAVRAVVLAERDDSSRAAVALQAGASGWVAKDCSLSRLLVVVRGVLRDETHVSPALLTGVLRELTEARKHRTESERLVESLTPREQEVLRCMVAGLGRKAVAERLFLSPHTVRTHMQNVLGKLGVHSTLAAVALARRAGVGPAEPETPAHRPGQGTGRNPGRDPGQDRGRNPAQDRGQALAGRVVERGGQPA